MKAQTESQEPMHRVCHVKDYNFHVGAETDTSLLCSQLADRAAAHRKKLDVSCNLGLKQYNFSLNGYLKLQDLPGKKNPIQSELTFQFL